MSDSASLQKAEADKIELQKQVSAYNQRLESAKPSTRGQATRFTNQYNVGNYMYPSDLMDPTQQYAGNYVIFYINVHEDSVLFRNKSVSEVSGSIPTRTKGYLSGQQVDKDKALATATVVNALGAGAARAITSQVGIHSGGAAGAAAIGFLATAAMANELGKVKSEYKRIQQAIALYMPTDLNISYGVQWGEEDMAGAGAMLGMGENVINAIKDDSKGIDGRIDELAKGLRTASSYVTGAVLGYTPMGNAIGKMAGVASNPKKEQIFKSVDYRTFTFSYQFFSRSPEEANNVRNIIKLFKEHMHPEYKPNSGNFLYIYPSEFDIFYYNNGVENMNLHRHTSCVLTNMSVQYTPSGQFNSFADGMPVQINVTLTFKELALLAKDLITDGF